MKTMTTSEYNKLMSKNPLWKLMSAQQEPEDDENPFFGDDDQENHMQFETRKEVFI